MPNQPAPMRDELLKLIALVDKATPGEWFAKLGSKYKHVRAVGDKYGDPYVMEAGQRGLARTSEDAEAIAAAINFIRMYASELRALARVKELEAKLAVAERDARLLNALQTNSWDLRCFGIPTGQDDGDIGWRVIEHHIAPPAERIVAEVYIDDPRAAIDAAIGAEDGK